MLKIFIKNKHLNLKFLYLFDINKLNTHLKLKFSDHFIFATWSIIGSLFNKKILKMYKSSSLMLLIGNEYSATHKTVEKKDKYSFK